MNTYKEVAMDGKSVVWIVTDSDLDGAVSALFLNKAELTLERFDEIKIVFTEINRLSNELLKISKTSPGLVYICDMSPTNENLSLFPENTVIVLDHHKKINKRFNFFHPSLKEIYYDDKGNHSAASLSFEYALELLKDHPYHHWFADIYRPVMEAARDYDLWQYKGNERATILGYASNTLVMEDLMFVLEDYADALAMYGREADFPESIMTAYRIVHQQIEDSLELAKNSRHITYFEWKDKKLPLVSAVIFGFHSHVADEIRLVNGEESVVFLFDLKRNHFNIRSERDDINVDEVAAHFENGGGHPHAAGFELNSFGHQLFKQLGIQISAPLKYNPVVKDTMHEAS